MRDRAWMLVLEPDAASRQIILDEAWKCRKLNAEVLFVDSPDQIGPKIAEQGVLPMLVLVEWFPNGVSIGSSLAHLDGHGILSRLFLVATSERNGRLGLAEAQALGAKRFISKLPDAVAFRGKIAEVFLECAKARAATEQAEALLTQAW